MKDHNFETKIKHTIITNTNFMLVLSAQNA